MARRESIAKPTSSADSRFGWTSDAVIVRCQFPTCQVRLEVTVKQHAGVEFDFKTAICAAARTGVGGMVELSRRQKQVLSLLAEGRTDDEIGLRLGISPRTARAHVDALKRKLGVTRRREIPSAYHRLTGEDPFNTEK